jgi:hypothetical protein
MRDGLEIFVAECRVKSNYATTNKIIFNDGIEYARRIVQKGYKKVAIVPDAAIAHLLLPESYYTQAVETTGRERAASQRQQDDRTIDWLAKPAPITKILFGFNGLNLEHEFAVHSCGHLALTLLAKQLRDEMGEADTAEVYLVGITSKCGTVHYKHVEPRSTKTWLTGGIRTLEEHGISDYNPVDDIIKLDLVDSIISDLGILSPNEFIEAFKEFLKEIGRRFESFSSSF